MPDTTVRPTPADIICHFTGELDSTGEVNARFTEMVLARLAEHGYVIVHPDDVDAFDLDGRELATEQAYLHGWNDCRAHIFGGTDA